MKTAIISFLAILPAITVGGTIVAMQPQRELRDIVGASHVAGEYRFDENQDFLNEGADALLKMGTRVIKVWFMESAGRRSYRIKDFPPVKSLVEIAQTEPYRKLFDKPFTTIVLEVYAPGRPDHYYLGGMSAEQIDREERDLYDLTKHLLTTYRGSGKTFILQNWEGDWSLRGGAPGNDPTPENIQGMIDWFNARQRGVERARKDAGADGVMVLHAAEVNLVQRAMEGRTTVTNDVLPHTRCDLYSYSAYDVPTHEPEQFRAALQSLADKAPDNELFGAANIYIGEYGAPENEVGGAEEQARRMRSATETALDFGCRYVIYWQLYCNEPKHPLTTRPTNDGMRGFWLIRPDGSKPPVTEYFQSIWK